MDDLFQMEVKITFKKHKKMKGSPLSKWEFEINY